MSKIEICSHPFKSWTSLPCFFFSWDIFICMYANDNAVAANFRITLMLHTCQTIEYCWLLVLARTKAVSCCVPFRRVFQTVRSSFCGCNILYFVRFRSIENGSVYLMNALTLKFQKLQSTAQPTCQCNAIQNTLQNRTGLVFFCCCCCCKDSLYKCLGKLEFRRSSLSRLICMRCHLYVFSDWYNFIYDSK